MAVSKACDRPPPKDMFIVAAWGLVFFTSSATLCKPAIMSAFVPWPWAFMTLTHLTVAFLATPNFLPAIVQATWVPWPLASVAYASLIYQAATYSP